MLRGALSPCFTKKEVDDLLSKDEILERSSKHTTFPCIYFLIKDRQIVYVGQTINLHMRLSQHALTKEFDHYSFEYCEYEKLDETEIAYILKFQPTLNANLPVNNLYCSLNKMKSVYQVNKHALNRVIRQNDIKPVFRELYAIKDFEVLHHE